MPIVAITCCLAPACNSLPIMGIITVVNATGTSSRPDCVAVHPKVA